MRSFGLLHLTRRHLYGVCVFGSFKRHALAELGAVMPALVPVRDAAELLFGDRGHQAYKKVLKLIHTNKLRHVAQGSRYYVVRSSIQELL